jgi:hypothetical protein
MVGLKEEEVKEILTSLEKYANLGAVLDMVMMSDDLNRIPLLPNDKIAGFLGDLATLGLLEASAGQMQKTKKFIELYRTGRHLLKAGPPKERF